MASGSLVPHRMEDRMDSKPADDVPPIPPRRISEDWLATMVGLGLLVLVLLGILTRSMIP
jgi:hypothetical protein